MANNLLEETQKGGYICLDCGEEIYDDTENPYFDIPYLISNKSLKAQAILHCMQEKHTRLLLRGTNTIITVKS